jgi:SanA protein
MNSPRLAKTILSIMLIPLILIASANIIVLSAAQDLILDEPGAIDSGRIGLIPGCPPTLINGSPNLYFEQRMDAAARLILSGRIKSLLLSGATDGGAYNEPAAMKRALLQRGLKPEQLQLDDQGNRTIDSLINVRNQHHGLSIVIITQRAHARRALFLAQHLGIDAVAFNAQTQGFTDTVKLSLRESLARVRAIFDVYLLDSSAI